MFLYSKYYNNIFYNIEFRINQDIYKEYNFIVILLKLYKIFTKINNVFIIIINYLNFVI